MADDALHTEILAFLDRQDEDAMGFSAVPRLTAALRAAVELHAPKGCPYTGCTVPHLVCSRCGSGISAPCDEIKIIANRLGITERTEDG